MYGFRLALPFLLLLGACTRGVPSVARIPVAGPAYEFRNGQWYDDGEFVRRTYYSVNGVLRAEAPSRVDSVIRSWRRIGANREPNEHAPLRIIHEHVQVPLIGCGLAQRVVILRYQRTASRGITACLQR